MAGWGPGYSYTIGPTPRPANRVSTSPVEIAHLLIAYIVLTFDFALLSLRALGIGTLGASSLIRVVAVAAAIALTGFILHELAHKVAAQRRGFWAEFRMSPMGLLLSVFTAYIGFLFASPGATVVGGLDPERRPEWGRTSLAGPAVNVGESLAFLGGAVAVRISGIGIPWLSVLVLLAFFNAWVGAFNLIPVGPLDGRKVLRWSPLVWVGAFAACAILAGFLFYFVYYTNPYL